MSFDNFSSDYWRGLITLHDFFMGMAKGKVNAYEMMLQDFSIPFIAWVKNHPEPDLKELQVFIRNWLMEYFNNE